MSSTPGENVDLHQTAYPYLTYVGMAMSIVFAVITAYRMRRLQRNLRVIFKKHFLCS